jgi:ABC-type branched-subunit amino acid transport system substrate-binding protein
MINEQGGVNGRTLNFVSLDDGYNAPKTVEQTRRLIEQERVAFIFGSLGGFTNLAIRQYLNENKIPHLFLASAADIVGDPEHYPWTIGLNPAISTEAHIYAKYILATKPDAKVGVLYQNDAFGKGFVTGMREGLGTGNASMIVKEVSYEVSDPTVDSRSSACRRRAPIPSSSARPTRRRRRPSARLAISAGRPTGFSSMEPRRSSPR